MFKRNVAFFQFFLAETLESHSVHMPLIYVFTVKMFVAEMRIKLIAYSSGNGELCCVQQCTELYFWPAELETWDLKGNRGGF